MTHSSVETLLAKWEQNFQAMREKDQESKTQGMLKGRYLREPYADSYAYYEIIRENKKSVRVRVVTEIGDDWVLPLFGEETTVDKEYAMRNIGQRDYFEDLVARRRNS